MHHHTHLILNEFPPLKRKPLLRWLAESSMQRAGLHRSFLAGQQAAAQKRRHQTLDRQTKIAFVLVREFGNRLSKRTIYSTLIDEVAVRLK